MAERGLPRGGVTFRAQWHTRGESVAFGLAENGMSEVFGAQATGAGAERFPSSLATDDASESAGAAAAGAASESMASVPLADTPVNLRSFCLAALHRRSLAFSPHGAAAARPTSSTLPPDLGKMDNLPIASHTP